MEQIYPDLDHLILEMSDGDADFQKQLTMAIHQGLVELKEVYGIGSSKKDEEKIQQIRHKLKPTLSMFELSHIIDELQRGKEIIESDGFEGVRFESHFLRLEEKLDLAIKRVHSLMA
ncbi:hypothetical protein [Algoriphagus sp.]|uniref:hypothetical protein n=1 Tax=Algoriphagus sp. TaxID=1872435 RepID=UPI0032783C2A